MILGVVPTPPPPDRGTGVQINTSTQTYLDSIVPGVEEADASDVGQDGIRRVVQHVVSGDRRETMSLR